MSVHQFFRREPVPAQAAQHLQPQTIPAPLRGLVESENLAYMQPGAAVVCDNWAPTLRGTKIRGGSVRWCDLHSLDTTVPPIPSDLRKPVVSAFEYESGNIRRMFAGQDAKLFDVTFAGAPTLVKSGQTSGNYCASQMAVPTGAGAVTDYMLVLNEGGDYPLRYDGTSWTTLNAGQIHYDGTPATSVAAGHNLTYVWKYRNRWFFIEGGTMNAYYLGINSIQGQLLMIPLSGAATKGGKLLFGATWSVDAGDGIDDKCVFVTDLGEVLIFTGSNPSDPANWRQEGRYQIGKPMGMNAHASLGGDLLIATVDGLTPLSASISKDSAQLELAMLTKNIRSTWRREALTKNDRPWSLERWDEYGAMFVAWPGGARNNRYCGLVNTATMAWARFTWPATCFARLRGDMFFGTMDGLIMQADRTGTDDGVPYVCTLVGGWEMFQSPPNTVVWHQARATFSSRSGETFIPQITACTDYVVTVPQPPPPGLDPGTSDVWDQGLWDRAKWDQEAPRSGSAVKSTGWVSVGMTGYSHAPVVQVTIAQTAKPDIELISIAATFERLGVNV